MKKLFFLLALMFLPLISIANQYCDDLNESHQSEQKIIPSDKSGYKVIEDNRLYFFNAPNEKCKMKDVFIIKNDLVDAYRIDGDFMFVMYFTKNNKTVEGWVKSRGLIPTGAGVGPKKNDIY